MKFFFRSKDDTSTRKNNGAYSISLTGRDYDRLLTNDVALKFRLSEETEQMVDEVCTYLDTSASDFFRQTLFTHLYGRYDLLGLLERQFPVLDVPRRMAITAPEDEPAGRSRNVADYKVWVPEVMKHDLAALAKAEGMTLSRYIRTVITTHLTGHTSLVDSPVNQPVSTPPAFPNRKK